MNLVDQSLHIGKAFFFSDSLHEPDADGSMIQIAVKIQQMGFEQMIAAVESRPDPDVDYGGE